MNLEFSVSKVVDPGPVVVDPRPLVQTQDPAQVQLQGQRQAQRGQRIGRCEFEQLLQRAMEIINARQLTEQLFAAYRQ
jgi:hypothetical protein